MAAKELSEAEAVQVAAFGLDRPPMGDRCPECRHAEHDGYRCLNMASDNDCACDLRPTSDPKIRDEVTLIVRDVHLHDGGESAALSGPVAQRIADAIMARFTLLPTSDPTPGDYSDLLDEAERRVRTLAQADIESESELLLARFVVALRTEQSALQTLMECPQGIHSPFTRTPNGKCPWCEWEHAQQRIDAAMTEIPSEEEGLDVRFGWIRAKLTATTESKEPDHE